MKKTFNKIISVLLVAVMMSGLFTSTVTSGFLFTEASANEAVTETDGTSLSIRTQIFREKDGEWVATDKVLRGESVKARVFIETDYCAASGQVIFFYDKNFFEDSYASDEAIGLSFNTSETSFPAINNLAGAFNKPTVSSETTNYKIAGLVEHGYITEAFLEDNQPIMLVYSFPSSLSYQKISGDEWFVEFDLKVKDDASGYGDFFTTQETVCNSGEGFYAYTSIPKVVYDDAGNKNAMEMHLWDADVTLESNPVSIEGEHSGECGNNLTWVFDETTGTLTISGTGEMYDYESGTRPWERYEDDIQNIVINDGVTSIGKLAFAWFDNNDLGNVIIPDSVTSIGQSAFHNSTGLVSVSIGSGVTSIHKWAFNHCDSLSYITVDSDNTAYSNDENGVLFNKDKTELVLHPMENTRTSYVIPDGVTSIAYGAFRNCYRLVSVTIPDSLTSFGESAFFGCKGLTNITIPEGVTSIGGFAFSDCDGLTTVTIPAGVTFIGDRAFGNCIGLTSISVDSANTAYSSDEHGVLFNKDKSTLVQYPIGNTRTSYTIPAGVVSIGMFAFVECTNITSVIIPKTVTNIDFSAFLACRNLTDVYYSGTEEQWNEITIGSDNESLINAKIHFNYVAPQKVVFDYGYDGLTDAYELIPGEKIILPSDPQREGYEFVGWTPEVPETMPENDVTFLAVYRKVVNHPSGNVELVFDESCFEQPCNKVLIQDEVPDDIKSELKASSLGYDLAYFRIAPVNDSGEKLQVKPGKKVTVRIKVSESEDNAAILERLNNNNPDDDPKISVSHITTDPNYKRLTRYKGIQVKYESGYIVFEVEHFSYFLVCVESDEPTVETKIPTLKIRNNPGTATVNYGDTLWLTADVSHLPEGCEVWWFFEDGTAISGEEVGTMVKKDDKVTVKILDSEGNPVKGENGNEISDTQEIKVKDSFWLRIVSFFKNLFRMNREIIQSFKGTI